MRAYDILPPSNAHIRGVGRAAAAQGLTMPAMLGVWPFITECAASHVRNAQQDTHGGYYCEFAVHVDQFYDSRVVCFIWCVS